MDSDSLVVKPVPENADRAWNLAFFLSNPVIIKAMDAALTNKNETRIANNVGIRKARLLIVPPPVTHPSAIFYKKSKIKAIHE